jgi:hypothetical protein
VLLQHLAGTQNTRPGPSWLGSHKHPASTKSFNNHSEFGQCSHLSSSSSTSATTINVNSPGRPQSGSIPARLQTGTTGKPIDAPTLSPSPIPWSITLSPHVPPPLTHGIRPEKSQEKPGKVSRFVRILVLPTRQSRHQYNPCRGSSIGRACGSYNSKEINLKVVGSSPTFGYSYIKAHQSSCSFAFCSFFCLPDVLTPPPACTEPLVP